MPARVNVRNHLVGEIGLLGPHRPRVLEKVEIAGVVHRADRLDPEILGRLDLVSPLDDGVKQNLSAPRGFRVDLHLPAIDVGPRRVGDVSIGVVDAHRFARGDRALGEDGSGAVA